MYLKRLFLAVIITLAGSIGVSQAQNPIDDAINGCEKELKSYCSMVKPGGGRLVSCIKAHEDKLSSKCVYALSRADFRLQSLALFLNYITFQCKDDAVKNCADVKLGDNRVLSCLAKNKSKLATNCVTALKDIGEIQ